MAAARSQRSVGHDLDAMRLQLTEIMENTKGSTDSPGGIGTRAAPARGGEHRDPEPPPGQQEP